MSEIGDGGHNSKTSKHTTEKHVNKQHPTLKHIYTQQLNYRQYLRRVLLLRGQHYGRGRARGRIANE